MVTNCKGWKEAALERIYVHIPMCSGERDILYVCMYASANRIWLPPGAFKGTPGSEWFKVRFRVSRAFFPADASPIFAADDAPLKGKTLFATNVYATDFEIRSPVAGETMSILQTEKRYLSTRLLVITRRISDEDTLGFYAPLASSTHKGECMSVCSRYFIHA